eukprot:1673421-Ditylum_brightwellii.AAC.1
MDTFFVTKKVHKSTRVPLKSKGEDLLAVKLFAKEVGAKDASICDAAIEQISHPMREFCTEIGTTLRVLEEGMP